MKCLLCASHRWVPIIDKSLFSVRGKCEGLYETYLLESERSKAYPPRSFCLSRGYLFQKNLSQMSLSHFSL